MKNFKEFVETALEGNGVQNDDQDVWVMVDGEQYTVSVEDVLGREEQEPFEASYTLEDDLDHEAWETLYDQYCQENGEAKKISTTHLFNAEEEIFFNEYENDTFEKVVDETAEESSLEEMQELINTRKYQIEELTW